MKKFVVLGVMVGIAAGVVTYGAVTAVKRLGKTHTYLRAPLQVVDAGGALTLQNAFVQVARTVKPSVVQITTEKVITERYWNPFGGDMDDFFGDFFGGRRPNRQQPQQPKTFKRKQQGLGSGFIVDENGYILTNNHVITGVDKIQVKFLDDEKKYEAKVIGADEKTDLALIKVDAGKKLPAVALGDSDAIEVGEWALAIGNPMGLEESVTGGLISGKGRSKFGITQYEDFIQTDAAINPGNSGGPLVNIRGEVIGINTFIVSPYMAQGLGFAIPVNIAKQVFAQLKEKGKVVRGYLGVTLEPEFTDEVAKNFGLKEAIGALITDVFKDTPAEKAGLQPGDIILELNGKPVKDMKDLQMKVANTPVDEAVALTVWRTKQKIKLSLKTAEMPKGETASSGQVEKSDKAWRGLRTSDITDEMREQFKLGDMKGVVVTEVENGSAAEENDIVPGTIIRRVGNTVVENLKEYQQATGKIKSNENVLLLVSQGGRNRWVSLKGD